MSSDPAYEMSPREEEQAEQIAALEAEVEDLRAELERIKAAPVAVPPLNGEELAYDHWTLQDAFKDGTCPRHIRYPWASTRLSRTTWWMPTYSLAASRARTIGPGEVVANAEELRWLRHLHKWVDAAEAHHVQVSYNLEHQASSTLCIHEISTALVALDRLRTQATTSGEGEP